MREAGTITLTAEARTTGPTGVEMEAMTAASVAALTVYDMIKGIERGAEIGEVVLLEKSGGRSGHWTRGAVSTPRRSRRRRISAERHGRELGPVGSSAQ